MRIAHVASEVAPYSQTGGLAQVAAALPDALARLEGGTHQVSVFTPLYPGVRQVLARRAETLTEDRERSSVSFDGRQHTVRVHTLRRPSGLRLHFLDCPALFDRDGIYEGIHGDYVDNAERFATFCRASLESCERSMGGSPDVFHCHDWQTGLLPLMLREHLGDVMPDTRTVFTIHNLAYQGCFPKHLMEELELPWSAFTMHGLEFFDQVSTLKAGIAFADASTTVSVSYADEIRTPEFGCHLDGFLREDCPRLIGIRNGIDVEEWNPGDDPHLAQTFDADHLEGKAQCRQALLREYGLNAGADELLVGVVSRLADQKGLDLVADIVPELHSMGARLILVGNGEAALEDRFRWLERIFRENLSVYIGFDVARAHRVFAGADAFLMPSRFEPCGLGQMAAMRYGTVPIVHAVGGLRDTVDDPGDEAMARGQGNGFRFEHPTAEGLRWALERAARIHGERGAIWTGLMKRGMAADWSWSQSARDYLRLYRELSTGGPRAHPIVTRSP